MHTRYINRAKHLVILELNSGETIHLSPNDVSRAVEAYETTNNRKIEKLLRNRMIEAVIDS